MTYNGSLGGIGSIIDLSQSVSADKVLAIPTSPDTEVWKYDYSILNFRSRIRFPTFPVNGHGYASHGKFVFFSADGSRYSVLVQADASSGTAFDYGIFTLGTDVEQFIITATAATGGTITPWSEVPVYEGNNQSFIIAPSTGYHTSDVMVDGVSVGVVTRYKFTNVTSNHTIAATFAKNADLIVSTLTGPIDVAPGQVISLSEATRNQGTGATTVNTVTRFYWSTNTTYDASDVMLGQRTVGPLAAGETSGPVDTSVTIPPTAVPGTYYIMAWADADKSVAEIANNNNRRYKRVTVPP